MVNKEIAKIFYEIAAILKTQEDDFRALAYERAAEAIESMEEDVKKIYEAGGLKKLMDIPKVGESLALKIEEYIKKGKIKFYDEVKKQLPIKLDEIVAVEGMGYKKAKILYKKLKIKNLKELEKAAKKGQIRNIAGFGEKTEKNILTGIEFLKRDKGRFLLGDILPIANEIENKIKLFKEVKSISTAGSLRRRKETIGDMDFLVVSDDPKKVADFFVSLPGIVKVWGKGLTKCSVRFEDGFDADLRVLPAKSFGSALQYFTGSTEHNIAMRRIAIEKGLKLNEYGVFRGDKMIAGKTEEEVYKALGLPIIPPEIRENQGEIEAAMAARLPILIEDSDINGDLHCHSNWDGGENSIKEMANEAQRLGYKYIGISDHTKFLRIENGLNEEQLMDQKKEIDKLNKDYEKKGINFKIFHGCEANIMNDGSIDIKDDILEKMDYVIAGVHSNLKMTKSEMTNRIVKAMENPNVDIISHPTGRLIKKRDEYEIDFDHILEVASQTNTTLEINSYPERLDLKDTNIRKTKEAGVMMIINTDSHNKNQLNNIKFGVSQARRGWAEKENILNTKNSKELINFFNK